jgi:hypothetical protein
VGRLQVYRLVQYPPEQLLETQEAGTVCSREPWHVCKRSCGKPPKRECELITSSKVFEETEKRGNSYDHTDEASHHPVLIPVQQFHSGKHLLHHER